MPLEVELKLALDPASTAALRAHPLLARYSRGRARQRQLENLYHDTPDAELWREGLDLRLRHDGGRHVQTLKAFERAHGGLHRRREWEMALAAPALDLTALQATLASHERALAARLQTAAARADFGVQVTTRFRRTTWQLQSAAGDEVELALDEGHIEAAAQRLPLCEVELELRAGRECVLFELAAALQQTLPLRPELRGKAERGFALLLGAPAPAPRHALAVPLPASATLLQAVRLIVEECLAQVQANEAGVVGSAVGEYVHQMRVGLRRLRSALGLVKEVASPPPGLLAELRWAASELGRARDAEVLALETLPRVPAPGGAGGDAGWALLREAALAAADAARREAVEAVRTPRHVAWQLKLMQWATGLEGAADEAAHGGKAASEAGTGRAPSLAEFSKRKLRRLRRRLVAKAEPLEKEDGDAQQRHDLRIATKKLRYAIEMLGLAQGRADAVRAVKALATLQQQLGLLNDAEVAAALLARLVAVQPGFAAAAGYARGWLAADAAHRVRRLPKLWRAVHKEL
jgi:inorganic triphosphatase YgiF